MSNDTEGVLEAVTLAQKALSDDPTPDTVTITMPRDVAEALAGWEPEIPAAVRFSDRTAFTTTVVEHYFDQRVQQATVDGKIDAVLLAAYAEAQRIALARDGWLGQQLDHLCNEHATAARRMATFAAAGARAVAKGGLGGVNLGQRHDVLRAQTLGKEITAMLDAATYACILRAREADEEARAGAVPTCRCGAHVQKVGRLGWASTSTGGFTCEDGEPHQPASTTEG